MGNFWQKALSRYQQIPLSADRGWVKYEQYDIEGWLTPGYIGLHSLGKTISGVNKGLPVGYWFDVGPAPEGQYRVQEDRCRVLSQRFGNHQARPSTLA